MRTTVHLDDDLLERLRERAQTERTSLTRCINYLLRKALESSLSERPKRRFRQETFRMGVPAFDLEQGAVHRLGVGGPRGSPQTGTAEMKIVDANILLYAVNEDAVHHSLLRGWWENAHSTVTNPSGFAGSYCWHSSGLRLTLARFAQPLQPERAIAVVTEWISHPNTRMVTEIDSHWSDLSRLLKTSGTAGNLTTDAHLASLAISRGAMLVSCDTDFSRFSHLRWENPLDSVDKP